MFEEVEEKKEKKKEKIVIPTRKVGLVKVKNRSGQRQTLNFKREPSIRVNVGETTDLTPEQFESNYFKNRAKYFSVVKEA